MILEAGRSAVSYGAMLFKNGIFFERMARSYREFVNQLPTTRAVKMAMVIGVKMLIELVVSSMTTSREKVRRVYADSIAPAPINTKVTAMSHLSQFG